MLASSGSQRGRQGLDLQAAPGRQVPRRPGDDRRRRRLDDPAAVGHEERLQRAVEVRRRARARRACARSTTTPSPSTSRRPTATSRTWSPPTTTTRSSSPRAPTSGKWQKTFVGTGPFMLEKYTQKQGATFVANPDYWGGKPNLAATEFTFYELAAAADPRAAGRAGRRDRPVRRPGRRRRDQQLAVQDDQAQVVQPPRAVDAQRPGAVHRQARAPGDGAALNRPGDGVGAAAAVRAGRQRQAVRPKFPSTDTSVPQRAQDIAKAKQLLAAAGHGKGFKTR